MKKIVNKDIESEYGNASEIPNEKPDINPKKVMSDNSLFFYKELEY